MMEIPQSALNKIASQAIKAGDVYRMRLTEAEGVKPKDPDDDSRNKYFIVMGTAPDGSLIGFVIINSEINENMSKNIQDYHYKIKYSDYPFLKKDRYVCCGELKQISTSKFFERFQNDKVATISEDHLEVITSIMAESGNVPVKLMKLYGLI